MLKHLLSTFCLAAFALTATAQVYVDQLDNADFINSGSGNYTFVAADSELTITGNGNAGAFDAIAYQLNDGAMQIPVDVTGNNKLFIRAKASAIATQLRVDLQDATGFATTQNSITKVLTNDFIVL